jgi:hypothetical protein
MEEYESDVPDESTDSVLIEDDVGVLDVGVPIEKSTVVITEEPEVQSVPEVIVIEEAGLVETEVISDQFVIKIGKQWVKKVVPYILGGKSTALVSTYDQACGYQALIKMRRHVVGEIVKL